MAATLDRIPYTRELGFAIEHAVGGEVRMTLPDDACTRNLAGTVHAGALYTFGETVAGVAAGIETLDQAFPFARRAEIRYLRPARGTVRGSARVAPSDSKRILEEIARAGRSELSVAVRLENSRGETVAEMNVDYAFRSVEIR
jgi:acyl-coenzyme A thioesterase PaaI-like protein